MLGIMTGYERTNLINKEMQKDLLTLAYINPELTLDEDNPETGKPYHFLDYCIITDDNITLDVKEMAQAHLGVENPLSELEMVSYINSDIYGVVKDYVELLKGQEAIDINGEKGTFQEWSEVMWQRLSREEVRFSLPELPHLQYIMINDITLAEIYDKFPEELSSQE